jgi:SAM-dependent methyltransferase
MQRTGWWLDELAYAGDEHLDPEYVTGYDRKSATDHSEDLDVLRSLGLNERSVVVDFGAGTGTLALAVAPFCRRVIAVDVSPAMLKYLRARAEQQGLANVEAVQAGLLSYEHHGAPADFVYSRNALHHLSDFWKALALKRVADMLEPGGVLRLHDLVYSFEPAEAEDVVEFWLAGARERPEEGWTRAELETHIREEYSTYSWLLEPLLDHAGFEISEATYRPSRTYAAYTCVKR